MAISYEPFRELDELRAQLLSGGRTPRSFPMDAYRRGDNFFVHVDLPGVNTDSIDVTVEGGTLTISAERGFEQQEDDEITSASGRRGGSRASCGSAGASTPRTSPPATTTAC